MMARPNADGARREAATNAERRTNAPPIDQKTRPSSSPAGLNRSPTTIVCSRRIPEALSAGNAEPPPVRGPRPGEAGTDPSEQGKRRRTEMRDPPGQKAGPAWLKLP